MKNRRQPDVLRLLPSATAGATAACRGRTSITPTTATEAGEVGTITRISAIAGITSDLFVPHLRLILEHWIFAIAIDPCVIFDGSLCLIEIVIAER